MMQEKTDGTLKLDHWEVMPAVNLLYDAYKTVDGEYPKNSFLGVRTLILGANSEQRDPILLPNQVVRLRKATEFLPNSRDAQTIAEGFKELDTVKSQESPLG